jgi:hypothetical protein
MNGGAGGATPVFCIGSRRKASKRTGRRYAVESKLQFAQKVLPQRTRSSPVSKFAGLCVAGRRLTVALDFQSTESSHSCG